MKKIGIISDTHGYWDDRYAFYFHDCNLILHAGDIGSPVIADRLEEIAPLKAVYGNIDGPEIRGRFPEIELFCIEEVEVMMTHIGGYPGKYEKKVREMLADRMGVSPIGLFISGHSHILKVVPDPKFHLLHINPGAAGLQGWQSVRTLVILSIDGSQMKNVKVIELSNHP